MIQSSDFEIRIFLQLRDNLSCFFFHFITMHAQKLQYLHFALLAGNLSVSYNGLSIRLCSNIVVLLTIFYCVSIETAVNELFGLQF